MLLQKLDSPLAGDIARAMIDGFNRHYQLFRTESARARHRFETSDWHGQQRGQRERIEFYDLRVRECSRRLEREFKAAEQPMEVWQQVKLLYIGMLVDHRQPELAETFFNSVTTKILHRSYFQNDFIFVRPAISTEYIEPEDPARGATYRAYYPRRDTILDEIRRMVRDFGLRVDFEDFERDTLSVHEALMGLFDHGHLRANFQIQVLSSLFYRNKGAYVVGKVINGFQELPFALPILHAPSGKLVIDALLDGEDELLILFSFARAYFMVDMEIPSAYVQFLRSLMPRKPRAEFYNALGLAKQGKTLFYRDFLSHLRHSTDRFRIAPGIKGMVMLVFDLPSFPFVFKVIKDFYPSQKDTSREQIRGKYLLVKQHDRVGRMADTLEFSEVAFPFDRFEPELVAELQKFAPSQLEISDRDGDGQTELILKHLYIERRMIPLNIYLQEAFDVLRPAAAPPTARCAARRSRSSMPSSNTATRSRTWWPPTSSRATCSGRTSASRATARWCSTTMTRSSTSPTATSAGSPRRATRRTR
jgi:isocitrate dehydrogenase kinase/phosphatase